MIQIEGQLQFIELEHAVLLLWIEWRIMSGVKWSILDETITVTVTWIHLLYQKLLIKFSPILAIITKLFPLINLCLDRRLFSVPNANGNYCYPHIPKQQTLLLYITLTLYMNSTCFLQFPIIAQCLLSWKSIVIAARSKFTTNIDKYITFLPCNPHFGSY